MRLARHAPRHARAARRAAEEPCRRELGWPLAAFALALVGALAFVAGDVALWPLWVAGLVAVCGSVAAYRP